MKKADMVERVSAQTGLKRRDVLMTLEVFFRQVKTAIKEGDQVHLHGFGRFTAKKRAAKKGRIFNSSETISIPEHHVPFFKPSDAFLKQVKKNFVPKMYE
jgi:DNA-binding protein HU-beta